MVGHYAALGKKGNYLSDRDISGRLAGYIGGSALPAGHGLDRTRTTGAVPGTDPVAPNGEFVIDATDVTLPGYGIPFSFSRHYRSSVMYSTPLGYGWNHDFARRIVTLRTTPTIATPSRCANQRSDVAYVDARMNRVRFVFAATSADGSVDSYAPTAGEDLQLVLDRKKNKWVLTGEGDTISAFDAFAGTLSSVSDYAGHSLTVDWDRTSYDEWWDIGGVVKSVTDTTGRVIRFNYALSTAKVSPTSPYSVTGHVLQCLSTAADCSSKPPLVSFDTSPMFVAVTNQGPWSDAKRKIWASGAKFEANLIGVHTASGSSVTYTYDESGNASDGIQNPDRYHAPHEPLIPPTEADAYCHQTCDADNATCSTADACQRAIDEMQQFMCSSIRHGKTPFWIVKDAQGHVQQVTGPHADYPNPGTACYEYCLTTQYSGGTAAAYQQAQVNCIYAAEETSYGSSGAPYDACEVTYKPACSRQLEVLQANIGACRTSCLSSCIASFKTTTPNYDDGLGSAHRLLRVTDGEGRVVVDNEFANDPSKFDYGRVIKHAQGASLPGTPSTTMTFRYQDGVFPRAPQPIYCSDADFVSISHLVSVVDTAGITHNRRYDGRWRLVLDSNTGSSRGMSYAYKGDHLRGFRDSSGITTCIDVDAAGKPTMIVRTPAPNHRAEPKPVVTTIAYDSAEQVIQVVDDADGPEPRGVQYRRDAAERIIAVGQQASARQANWTCYSYDDTPLGSPAGGGGGSSKSGGGDTPPIYVPSGGVQVVARVRGAGATPRAQSFVAAIAGGLAARLVPPGAGGGGGPGPCPSWGCSTPMFKPSGCALTVSESEHTTDPSYLRATTPSLVTRPDGSLVIASGVAVGGPTNIVVTDSDGVTSLAETYVDYDSYGRPAGTGRIVSGKRVPGTGVSTTYDPTTGHLLKTVRESANGGSPATTLYDFDKSDQFRKLRAPTFTRTLDVDALGHVVAVSEAPVTGFKGEPRRACFNVDVEGRVHDVIHAEGDAIHYEYDSGGERIVAESRGALGTYGAWATGCVQLTPKSMETFATYEFEPSGFPNSRIAEGRRVKYAVDGFGRIVDEEQLGHMEASIGPSPDDPNKIITIYFQVNLHRWRAYNAFGEPILEASYDVLQDLKKAPPDFAKPDAPTPGLHALVEYGYDRLGRRISQTNWRFTEQGAGLVPPTPLPDPAGDAYSTVQYDDLGNTVTATDPDGHVVVQSFDSLGRPRARTTAAGEAAAISEDYVWSTTPDPASLDVMTVTRSPAPTSTGTLVGVTRFDAHGRARTVMQADRKIANLEYDDFDRLLHRTTPQLGSETFEVDAYGRLTVTHRPFNGGDASTTTQWDRNDRVATVTDGAQHSTSYSYDSQGRFATETTPLGTTSRTYVAGRMALAKITAPGGVWVTYGYRPSVSTKEPLGDGRLESRTAGVGTIPDLGEVYYYTAAGLVERTTTTGARSYDSLGRVVTDAQALTLRYTYSAGAEDILLDGGASKARITRHFDGQGRVTAVDLNQSPVATLDYTKGAVTGIAYANGVTQSWSYDDRGRAVGTSVIRGGSVASTALKYGGDDVPRVRTRSLGSYVATDLYKADGIGRVIGDSLAIPGIPTIPGSGAGNVRDVSNEDVQAAWSATAPGSSLTFDGASNWTSRSGTNAFTPTIDSMNRYASIGADIVQYDSLGRISSYRDETYGFNADGRLMSATKDRASTQYWYDGEGRRKAEQRDGHMTAFVWDGDRIIATVPDKDVSLARIRLGAGSDDTLALVDGFGSGAARFIHADVDGSTIAATNSSGMLLEAYAYSAYGETTFLDAGGRPLGASTFNNRFLFQGQLYDPQLGAYSMRAREYKPVWGRFLSPDPAGIAFSDNRYAFVDGRPLTMADPSGLAQVNGLYQQAWASSYSWGSTGALDDHYRGKFGLTSRYAAEMAGVRSTATRANWAKGNYGLVAINASLGAIDVFGVTVLGNNTRQTIEKVATGIVVGGAVGTFFKWAAGTAPLWTPLASSGASAAGTTIGAGAGVVGADAVMTSGLAGDISVADSIAAEVDAAFSSERVQSGTMIEFTDAKGPLSGSGPKNGNGDIWFHDNITVPDGGPGGAAAKIRTHSPNPNAPVGTFSSTNYTTQINTSSGLYRLPDGTWKPLSDMTPAELSLAHIPAGN